MATNVLSAEASANKSPIVQAYRKAFKLDREHEDTDADDPEAQFAYAAMEGATNRVLECGIHSLDHAALAALLSLDEIDKVIDGLSTVRDGERVIPVEDARIGFLLTQKALKGIWDFASREAGMPREEWADIVRFYGAHRI